MNERRDLARVVAPHLAEALAARLTGNATDGEGIVQESNVRTYRAIHAFAEDSVRADLDSSRCEGNGIS